MKRFLSIICLLLAATVLSTATAQKHSEFRPGAIWEDTDGVHINCHGGGILHYKKKYYWFGEHKVAGEAGNRAQVGVSCYSSTDLYNWKNEGIALPVSDNPDSDITRGCILERPKVIYNAKTRKFVMWFHLELKGQGYSSARCGIAVADKVTGPYRFIRSTRSTPGRYPVNVLPEHKGEANRKCGVYHPDSVNLIGRDLQEGQMVRDMQLFVDDDGKAYHIFASEENSTLHIAELTDDYLDYTGKYVRAFVNRSMEAPAVFKKDGLYYFMGSGCTGWAPNAARSAVAPSIWGPWRELGNPCVGPDANTTFHSQSTYILPAPGHPGHFIYMGDRWTPKNAIDGRHIWLPIDFEDDRFTIRWHDAWNLDYFGEQTDGKDK